MIHHLPRQKLREIVARYGSLVHLRAFTGLTHISLESTDITDTGLVYLRELISLSNLDLSWTQITDEGLARLTALTG